MSLSAPSKILIPFAMNGNRNVINATLATGDANNKATYNAGFPQVTMTPKASGGLPPFGRDMNGILFDITSILQFMQAGGVYPYDATFARAIDGYAKGAILQQADLSGLWVSTADNNVSNPETTGANWMPLDSGSYSFSVSTANVTLTNAQAAHPVLIIDGTLTGARSITVPKFRQIWTIINNVNRGNYTLSIKTSDGTGVSLKNAVEQVVCDGANVYKVGSDATAQVPVGGKIDWYSPNIPDGYLVANGQAVSRILYPDLFSVYGTIYGAGDGSTTFNLPDLITYFGRYGTTSNVGQKVAASIESHTHTVIDPGHIHDLVDSGHTHAGTASPAGSHTHDRGTMEIKGSFRCSTYDYEHPAEYGSAIYNINNSGTGGGRPDKSGAFGNFGFQASRNWTGVTSEQPNHTHDLSISSAKTGIAMRNKTTGIDIENTGGAETAPKHIYEIPIIRAV